MRRAILVTSIRDRGKRMGSRCCRGARFSNDCGAARSFEDEGRDDHVAAYVKSQGGDPRKVKNREHGRELEDALLIDPATMDYYDARFNQNAPIRSGAGLSRMAACWMALLSLFRLQL